MSMMDQLLFIKSFREGQAQTKMQRCRAEHLDAQAREQATRQALEQFITQAREDEARWYRELCDRLVKLSDIETVQQDIAILRAEQLAREEAVRAQAALTESARLAFSESALALREASAARNKFEELRRNEREAFARESERREELELEEVAGIRRDRDDEVSFEDD
jgi:type III secretion protein O